MIHVIPAGTGNAEGMIHLVGTRRERNDFKKGKDLPSNS